MTEVRTKVPFGWCLTKHHSSCIERFHSVGAKGEVMVCSCECHGQAVAA